MRIGPNRLAPLAGAAVALAVLTPGSLAAQRALAGTWEYRQANSARPDGFDAEGERLVIDSGTGGRVSAQYFGLEREGEHGLFYTAVDVGALDVAADGTIRFIVPARTLYRTRPTTLADAARLESAGSTTDVLTFTGRVTGDILALTCAARAGACPAARLVFHRPRVATPR